MRVCEYLKKQTIEEGRQGDEEEEEESPHHQADKLLLSLLQEALNE